MNAWALTMALFGRETQADLDRARRATDWLRARSGYSLVSVMMGIIAVVDSFTLVIGIIAGVIAIATGVRGLSECRRDPAMLGRRLAIAGVALGVTGLMLSIVMWTVIFPMIEQSKAA
jgi:hypothetical protein